MKITPVRRETTAAVCLSRWATRFSISGHQFYLGRPLSAVCQILSYLVAVGFIWLLIDLFLIPGMIRDEKARIRHQETQALLRNKTLREVSASPAQPASVDPSPVATSKGHGAPRE